MYAVVRTFRLNAHAVSYDYILNKEYHCVVYGGDNPCFYCSALKQITIMLIRVRLKHKHYCMYSTAAVLKAISTPGR